MNAGTVRVIVPMKPVAECKRRLSALPDATREALVLLMLDRTVRAVTEALGAESCWVIGGDAMIRQVSEAAGGRWLVDAASDLNATVTDGMRRAFEDGARAAVFVPADTPMVSAQDVRAVVDASDDLTSPVGVEALADGGTNALLVPAGSGIEPALGHRSYARHRAAAEEAGFTLVAAPAYGLVFDIDSPADLTHATETIAGFAADLARWAARVETEARTKA